MTKYCYHCASPIPEGLLIKSERLQENFCCHACLAVAELINDENLEQYYKNRSASAPRPKQNANPKHWQAYDRIAEQYVYRNANGEQEIHLYIDGIHCAACTWLIKKVLMQSLDLQEVNINTGTTRAEIRWNSEVKLSEILEKIASLGYQPDVYNPDTREKRLNQERNQYLLRLIIAALASMQVMMLATGSYFGINPSEINYDNYLRWAGALCAIPVIFYSALPIFRSAFSSLKNKHLNMDFPIALALGGAFIASIYHTIIGHGEIYFDSVCMFVFFISVSRFIEFLSRRKARLNEHRYGKLLPEVVESASGEFLPLITITSGMELRVRAGATVPCDGIIINGKSRFDESMLNGESAPIYKQEADLVLAGSNNLQSVVDIKVSATGQNTVLAGIKRLVARAEQQRAPQLDFHQKLAEWTIITVLILAAIAWIIWQFVDPNRAFEIVLAVLVATCPCALALATPTTLTAAINHAQKQQILFKDSATLHRLTNIKNIVFDKTGTLSTGKFQLQEALFYDFPAEKAWQIAKSLEQYSNHPIAWFFTQQEIEALPVDNAEQITALGVSGFIAGEQWFIGSKNYAQKYGLHIDNKANVYLFNRQKIVASFLLSDPLRPNLQVLIAQLSASYKLAIASGDKEKMVREVAEYLQISDFKAELSPEDKLNYLQNLSASQTLMIGDGSNDAPVLAAALVSVAVVQASSLSQSHADIVLLKNSVEALPYLFNLAEKVQKIIKQNILISGIYNFSVVPLALAGYLNPWIAALGMSASSLIVVLNALRITKIENLKN